MSYAEWMKAVTFIMTKEYGLEPDDIPDYVYRESYNAGDSPVDVIEDVIEYIRDCY